MFWLYRRVWDLFYVKVVKIVFFNEIEIGFDKGCLVFGGFDVGWLEFVFCLIIDGDVCFYILCSSVS